MAHVRKSTGESLRSECGLETCRRKKALMSSAGGRWFGEGGGHRVLAETGDLYLSLKDGEVIRGPS